MELSERVLDDDYPVHYDYFYVSDGEVVRSDVKGTVRDLRHDLQKFRGMSAQIIMNCDIEGRRKILKDKLNENG